MSHEKGACIGGVRTAEDLKARCRIGPDDDACWLWLKAVDKRGTPKLWFSELNATVTLSSVICFLTTGKRPPRGIVWYPHCDCRTCANPTHWRAGTIASAMRRSPRKNPILHKAKVTAARRAMSKLTPDQVEEIRGSLDTLDTLSERYSMSRSAVHRIRKGHSWRPLNLAFASVFNLGSGA